jgi:hypothetical protein
MTVEPDEGMTELKQEKVQTSREKEEMTPGTATLPNTGPTSGEGQPQHRQSLLYSIFESFPS